MGRLVGFLNMISVVIFNEKYQQFRSFIGRFL